MVLAKPLMPIRARTSENAEVVRQGAFGAAERAARAYPAFRKNTPHTIRQSRRC